MKTIKALLLGLVAAAICACIGLTIVTRTVDPRAWYAETLVRSLNHRLISIHQLDWGHLKLRSGPYGIAALNRLKREGAGLDIRMMASVVLKHYDGGHGRCDDEECASDNELRAFQPSPHVLDDITDLPDGVTLPDAFLVDAAYDVQSECYTPAQKRRDDRCTVRIQDFNADGQTEIYVERFYRTGDDAPEDQHRDLKIYHFKDGEWLVLSYVSFWGFDAMIYSQRPFVVEPAVMDHLRINGRAFRFEAYPKFVGSTPVTHFGDRYRKYLPIIGASLDHVEILFPKGAQLPADLGRAMTRDQIGFERITNNPMLPIDRGNGPVVPPASYTFAPGCPTAKDCKAVILDLDHDGFNEVIFINDPRPGDEFTPFDATLFKTDGKTWTVKANVELCKEIVPGLAKAKIEVKSSSWGTLRLGDNRYPVISNPWCDNGVQLL